MEFQVLFMKEIVKDYRADVMSSTMDVFCQTAYEASLKPYHGMIARAVFYVSVKDRYCVF